MRKSGEHKLGDKLAVGEGVGVVEEGEVELGSRLVHKKAGKFEPAGEEEVELDSRLVHKKAGKFEPVGEEGVEAS